MKSTILFLGLLAGLSLFAQSAVKGTSAGLPPGLQLSSAGVISGTPSVAGVYQFSVQVCDNESPASCQTGVFQITIYGPVVITTGSLPPGVLNQPYQAQLNASGGSGTYVWSIQ